MNYINYKIKKYSFLKLKCWYEFALTKFKNFKVWKQKNEK